jgi:2-keto-4-pentenoate hydratase/2-oxohepta-3-ene-1,7-dioic acid hydratase in catechol pathway
MKGKCLDRTCPLGPYIVHKNDIDAADLRVQLWVNGEVRQDSTTSNMIFNVSQIISQLSQGMTLVPGDVILTGTPAGVGFAMNPPNMLKQGDSIRIEIEGLGCLQNSVGP